jgi:pyruvate formate lyase activating enzyme
MTDFITHDTVKTSYWHKLEDGRIQCDVCPRFCKLHEGQTRPMLCQAESG